MLAMFSTLVQKSCCKRRRRLSFPGCNEGAPAVVDNMELLLVAPGGADAVAAAGTVPGAGDAAAGRSVASCTRGMIALRCLAK